MLGPTYDNGYYLVAARHDALPGNRSRLALIFDGINWSSDSVWRETTERLEAAGCHYEVLPKWYDVDDDGDLACLASDLAAEVDDSLSRLRRAVTAAHSDDGTSDS